MATKFITVSIDIMHDKNLSPNQKFILAEIHQLSSLEKGCVASNRHFSELIGITTMGVSKAINDLATKGYIIIDNAQTKRNFGRVITINSGKSPINCGKSDINSGIESKENKTINKTKNNKNTKKDLLEEYKKYDPLASQEVYNYAEDFIKYRKEIAKPLKTIAPIKSFIKELTKLMTSSGIGWDYAIKQMKEREWQTIKQEWVLNIKKQSNFNNTSSRNETQETINRVFDRLEEQKDTEIIDYDC